MKQGFHCELQPARVLFGFGTLSHVGEEARALGMERPFLLVEPTLDQAGQQIAGDLGIGKDRIFTGIAMHTPVLVTKEALTKFNAAGADGIISLGGGSTTGLSKAIALRNDAPQLVIPTTYAGSEMTRILGQTEDGKKTTINSASVLPETVIYDVDLTLSIPRKITVASALNAMAHAVEALYAQDRNPLISMVAEEGIRSIAAGLDRLSTGPLDDRAARYEALYGAWLCSICLGLSGVALHHKICHVLGGSFGLPHAETHTVILPHALTYNAPAIPKSIERLRRAMGTMHPAGHIFDLAKSAGVPVSLNELGFKEQDVALAVRISLENPYYNPRPLEEAGLRQLLTAACNGSRPNW